MVEEVAFKMKGFPTFKG